MTPNLCVHYVPKALARYVPQFLSPYKSGKRRLRTIRRFGGGSNYPKEDVTVRELTPLARAEKLAAWERKRDLNAELLEAIREVKTGRTGHVWRIERRADGTLRRKLVLPVAEIRKRTALSQSEFASVLGVSVRTLQDWEQGRREPSGAARTLLAIANRHPGVLKEAAA